MKWRCKLRLHRYRIRDPAFVEIITRQCTGCGKITHEVDGFIFEDLFTAIGAVMFGVEYIHTLTDREIKAAAYGVLWASERPSSRDFKAAMPDIEKMFKMLTRYGDK